MWKFLRKQHKTANTPSPSKDQKNGEFRKELEQKVVKSAEKVLKDYRNVFDRLAQHDRS